MENFNFTLRKYPGFVHRATMAEDRMVDVAWSPDYIKAIGSTLGEDLWKQASVVHVREWLRDGGWIKVQRVADTEDFRVKLAYFGVQIEAAEENLQSLKAEFERFKRGI